MLPIYRITCLSQMGNTGLYAIGGSSLSAGSGSAVATVEEYSPSTNTWTTQASMPTARFNIGVATAADGKIYVFGSWQEVEAYDPATNTWAAKASMPTPRFGPGVAMANNGKIYQIGGGNGPSVYSTVEEYDPATDTWAIKASMPTPRYNLGAATAANGKIYAVGGFTAQDATGSCCRVDVVEEYDPATNTWTTKTRALTARAHLGLIAATNGRLYMVGGSTISGAPATAAEEYDPATNSWKTQPGMPTPRWGAGVAIANNGKFYAIGGGGPVDANEEATFDSITTPTPVLPTPDFEIYVMGADGSNQTRLTDNLAANAWGAWSPDGGKIIFSAVRDGNREIYVMDADGSDQINLTNHPDLDYVPDWSPDGSKIAFLRIRDDAWDIYMMNPDRTNQTRLTDNRAY